jgi:hypothetical protein
MTSPAKFNSLLPLGVPAAEAINNLKANVAKLNTTVNNMVQNTQKSMNTAASSMGLGGGWQTALGIFVVLVVAFLFILSYYQNQIKDGYDYLVTNIKQALGYSTDPLPPMGGEQPGQNVLDNAVAPQEITPGQKAISKPLVEKILPNVGSPEVFNVSKNTFTYYDAEPLCRALGAELATYDQVKQKTTWDQIQAGPEDQRTSCGVPGLNGGYFDNPELRFGVNCYGQKPNQSQHDEAEINKGAPLSPGALEVQKKVAKFRTEAASIGIMPFSADKWSSN